MTSSLDDFLAAATRAARPDRHHPGDALEARAVLAECDRADVQMGGDLITDDVLAAITNARRNR